MITMNTLENMRFGEERALYASRALTLQNCRPYGMSAVRALNAVK